MTSILQYVLLVGLQIVLAPLVLRIAGQETLGAYSVLMQAIGYLAMVDLGFSIAVGRGLAQAYGLNDGGRTFMDTLTTGRTFTLMSNGVLALLIFLFSFVAQKLFNLSEGVATQARYGLWLLAIWAVVRTPLALYGSGLIATQNLAAANLIGILGNVARLILSLILVSARMGLLGLVLANIAAEFFTVLAQRIWFRHKFPEWHFGWGLPDRQLFKAMFRFGAQAMFIQVAVQAVLRSDGIVIGYLRGAVAVSIYYTTQMPTLIGYTIVNRLTENAMPAINELYARGEKDHLRDIFLRLSRYTLILVVLLLIGFLLFNKLVVTLWVGEAQYAGNSTNTALTLFAVMIAAGYVGNAFVMAKGRIRTLSYLSLGESIIHLTLAFWLGHYWGLAGVAWGSVIAHIPTFFYLQWRGQQIVGVNGLMFLKRVLIPLAIPSMILLLFQFIWLKCIFLNIWYIILFNLFSIVIIYSIAIYIFSLTAIERRKIADSIRMAFLLRRRTS